MFSVSLRQRLEPNTWAQRAKAYSANYFPTNAAMSVIRARIRRSLVALFSFALGSAQQAAFHARHMRPAGTKTSEPTGRALYHGEAHRLLMTSEPRDS